jgi:hypothetical protein
MSALPREPIDPVRTLLVLAAALSLPAANVAQSPPPSAAAAFEQFGRTFLLDLGEDAVPSLPALLEHHYERCLLADFDLCVPKGMVLNKNGLATVAAIAASLLGLQERLLEWTSAEPAAVVARRAELAALQKWLAAWRGRPAAAPVLPARPDPCVLILAPDRRAFVGFVGWLGLWKSDYRDFFWNDATAQFTDLRLVDEGQVQLIALEYPAPDQRGDVTRGYDMNTREKTGLLQHVLQRAAMSWTRRFLGDRVDHCFQLGFATALVVDLLGENNARSGGSGKANATAGQGGFIPGAPGAGGGMPVQDADSKWRLWHGKDWFQRPLQQAQKEGAHAAENGKDKLGHFLLLDQGGARKHVVSTPFLGTDAYARAEVPAEFRDDYLEFHRAYRAAFVHWLQTNGGKGKPASKARFGELLRRLMDPAEPKGFDPLCYEIYGVSISAKGPDEDRLERRFLAWLAKG